MNHLLRASGALILILGTLPAIAQTAATKPAPVVCATCGTVTEVNRETHKGKGGAVGVIAGAAAGGLLGNQIGKGTGNTVATVGGAVAGGVVGNEIQKKMTSKKVWVTIARMKDGSTQRFEQDAKPTWTVGDVVKPDANGMLAKQ